MSVTPALGGKDKGTPGTHWQASLVVSSWNNENYFLKIMVEAHNINLWPLHTYAEAHVQTTA